MKFNSVKEYFYKLNNIGYQAMMVPLICFIYFYTQSFFYDHTPLISEETSQQYLLAGLVLTGLVILTIVQLITYKKAKGISSYVGLGLKLERLGSVLKTQLIWLAVIALLMPLGLVATGHAAFTVAFGIALAIYFLHWPSPARVVRLLKLKGDEREMVLSRGEAFK